MPIMDGYRTLARVGLVAALVGVEIYLARSLTASSNVLGYTQTRSYSIAPARPAKVRTIGVPLGASVTAGQVVVELDSTDVDKEIEVAAAERERAIAAIKGANADLHLTVERESKTTEGHANAELASTEATARTAAAELAAVEHELADQKELVRKHLADVAVLNTLELRRAALAKQVDTAGHVLAVLRGNAAAAAQRSAGVDDEAAQARAPLEASLRATEIRLDQLAREKAALKLRAPVDGVVDQLPLHVGDLAAPGVPVAIVVSTDTMHVVACVPEARAISVDIGVEAELTAMFGHARGSGYVESLTTEITPLPARCQPPGGRAPVLGRLAVVALDAPVPGLPGQTQLVRFAARRRPRVQGPSAPAPIPTSAPARMQVPASLLARTRFEPSGLVWFPSLDRYVIVSDDTGFPGRDEHAPWVFAMTADGAVDPAPLVVQGIKQLNDLEAIAASDDGALWLLSSQSTSRRGRRPASRERLVRAVLQGGVLTADGVMDLAKLLDQSPAQRAALGITDTRTLDIEAMAFHGGALFLGLKAPVDDRGRAVIWRVGNPARLIAGDLGGAAVSVWSKVELTVDADGRAVPGGIADLLFLDDKTLVIAGTASGIDPAVQSGSLAVATPAPNAMIAKRVRTFDGLKPEGIALDPSGEHLTIVFDRGNEAAMWVELPVSQLVRDAK
jgi:multidrug resistance efflux pump